MRQPPIEQFEDLFASFARHLKGAGRTENTIRSYRLAVDQLAEYVASDGLSDPSEVTTDHIRRFLAHVGETRASATVRQRYASLRQFYNWLHAEGEIPANPITRVTPPKVVEQPVDVLTIEQMERLIDVTAGNTFEQRRDRAIIRTLLDTGIRLGELTGLTIETVDLDDMAIDVFGKGGRWRHIAFGYKTADELDRYVRARRRRPDRDRLEFWLGKKGPLTNSGVAQILKRRGEDAGLPGLHAHMFRHSFAHYWLLHEGSEGDLQRLAGWQSPQMLKRYGASGATERANQAQRRNSLGDRLA